MSISDSEKKNAIKGEDIKQSDNADITTDLPEFNVDGLLSGHEFKQEGEMLICVDDPTIFANLPTGVRLFGKRGSYELRKIF